MPYSFTRQAIPETILPGDVNELQVAIESVSSGVYNVVEYGAVGNGTTDDTAAIQAAIDAAAAATYTSRTGGGLVWLPPNRVYLVGTLRLKHHVRLVGGGKGTVLLARPSIIAAVVVLDDTHVQQTYLGHLRIDGNKTNVTSVSGVCHGVHYEMATVSDGTYELSDPYHVVHNVYVERTKDEGFVFNGRGECIFDTLVARDCDGKGFSIAAPDNRLSNCSAGNCGEQGFLITSNNLTITNCKSFYCGRVDPAIGHGFHFQNARGTAAQGLEAQDNEFHGFFLDNCTSNVFTSVNADSNNKGVTSVPDLNGNGIEVLNSSGLVITGIAWDRAVNTRRQKYGLSISGTTKDVQATLEVDANLTGEVLVAGTATVGLNLQIQGSGGVQYASSLATFAPNPYRGSVILATLNQALSVSNTTSHHHGQRLAFRLKQNATGGWATTWGTQYRLAPGWVPDTAANKVNTVEFAWDGTNWLQIGGATGL